MNTGIIKSWLTAFVFTIISETVNGQTIVSGGIYTNTSWTVANSPYIIIDTVTVFPGVSLSIQPGVVIQFNNDMVMEVRGELTAIGTISDSIQFTSSSVVPSMSAWSGVLINTNIGGSAQIRFCLFEYAHVAVKVTCCWNGGPLNISRSDFRYNYTALGGYAAWYERIDSCFFEFNYATITEADKRISNSVFSNNYYGIGHPWQPAESISVSNSEFCGNEVGISVTYADTLQNCRIMNNKVGYQAINGFNYVLNNIIVENDTGIIVTSVPQDICLNNIICNKLMNVVYSYQANKAMTNNCWCTTDSLSIANKIYDGYDNVNIGLIDFTPLSNCDSTAVPTTSNCHSCPYFFMNYSISDATPGLNDGAVKIIISGGDPPYHYSLDSTTYQSSSSFTELDTGTYRVFVIDGNGCSGQGTFTITYDTTASALNFTTPNPIRVFPNPFSDELFIELEKETIINLKLNDVFGRVVLASQHENTSTVKLDVTHIQQGVYYLEILDNKGEKLHTTSVQIKAGIATKK